jgi:SAM-dependent methyltransferase
MSKADYGIDAPTVVRNLLVAGVLCVALAVAACYVDTLRFSGFLLFPGLAWIATALWMLLGSRVSKLGVRDRLLNRVPWRGDEQVLDVGCGRGLLLLGAAKRVPHGKATGLDLWRTVDQSGNDVAVTRANAVAEGVSDSVAIETGDMTKMPFGDAVFDVVVSSWAIHNVPSADGRARALREIARVLRPGGRVELLDIGPARGYASTLRDAGLEVELALDNLVFAIPTWRVSGVKTVRAAHLRFRATVE